MKNSCWGPVLMTLSLSGCAAMMSDTGDGAYDSSSSYYDEGQGAVVGGRWPERSYLTEEPVQQRSIYDRKPAENVDETAEPFPYKRGNRATVDDFVNDSQNEGSLWASGDQTNYYFTRNKLRGPGDIITVVLDDQIIRDVAYEVKRGLTQQEREVEMFSASQSQRKVASNDTKSPSSSGGGAETEKKSDASKSSSEDARSGATRFADLDISPQLGVKNGDLMMAEVLERFPNGNYKLRAVKRIPYRGSYRMVNFLGIARAADIDASDQIPAGKFYEYRVKVTR